MAPELIPIDLSKRDDCDHPDIVADHNVRYLARHDQRWSSGYFTKQWYGLNFTGFYDAGLQLKSIDELYLMPEFSKIPGESDGPFKTMATAHLEGLINDPRAFDADRLRNFVVTEIAPHRHFDNKHYAAALRAEIELVAEHIEALEDGIKLALRTVGEYEDSNQILRCLVDEICETYKIPPRERTGYYTEALTKFKALEGMARRHIGAETLSKFLRQALGYVDLLRVCAKTLDNPHHWSQEIRLARANFMRRLASEFESLVPGDNDEHS